MNKQANEKPCPSVKVLNTFPEDFDATVHCQAKLKKNKWRENQERIPCNYKLVHNIKPPTCLMGYLSSGF